MPSAVISDQPTLRDALDRLGLVKGIGQQITECAPPQTFGVHGDWGSGKTSLLRQLRYHLTGETDGTNEDDKPLEGLRKEHYKQQVVTVWFEAWRYQNEPVPVVALLNEMRRQFGMLARLKAGTKKTVSVAFRSLLNSMGEIGGKLIGTEALPIHPDKIEAAGERWEREHLEQSLLGNTVHQFLEEAISTLLKELEVKSTQGRVVVFIDDLDRCNPESAYRLLEGLRIYLSLKNCVFVLGMNQQVVIDAIAHNLSKGEITAATRNRAEAYLEKLCTNVWRLPLVKDPPGMLATWLPSALQQRLRDDIAIGVSSNDPVTRHALPPNPRRLKAMASLLLRMMSALPPSDRATLTDAPAAGGSSLMQRLVILSYVYQFHGDLFQRWQSEPDFFREMSGWVRGSLGKPRTLPDGRTVYDLPDHFGRLQLPVVASIDESAPTPSAVYRSTYPDPTAAEVFWVGRLIAQLGNGLRPEDFLPLLHLNPAP